MNQRLVRDLFGKQMRPRRPLYKAALERADRASLADRAARVRWISKFLPRNMLIALPYQTYTVFNEIRSTFVSGQFVATIILTISFIEHWFVANLEQAGFTKKSTKTLADCIDTARKNNLVPEVLLNKARDLNDIRRPFVHLKPYEYQHNLGNRAINAKKHPVELLEKDAQESLILAYSICCYSFKR